MIVDYDDVFVCLWVCELGVVWLVLVVVEWFVVLGMNEWVICVFLCGELFDGFMVCEVEVFCLFVVGWMNKEIVGDFVFSVYIVEWYFVNVYCKILVCNWVDVIVYVLWLVL